MANFRFQDLEIWQLAIELARKLSVIADDLEAKKKYRFAEQLNGAALSISNNIAEGSGSKSTKDFINFLNFAHRSVFENANMVMFFNQSGYISDTDLALLLEDLDKLARKITSFQKYLSSK
ncbi:MAG: four helix bundle protein [Sphingobacteriaceae bacterium]